jgi:hypothetical protein
MNARDAILSAIRAAAVPAAPPAAPLSAAPAHRHGDGMHEAFLRVLQDVGGEGVVRQADQTLDGLLAGWFGDLRVGVLTVRGRFAVAENGAVYVDAADLEARNSIVLAEHLVVVVPHDAIVPTMHEAVRLMPVDSPCGWFLSGPSKTADIEQSLVFGAQGSRTHRVVFDAG